MRCGAGLQLRELVNDGDAASAAADAVQNRRIAARRRAIQSGEEELVRVIPKPTWGDTPCVASPHACSSPCATGAATRCSLPVPNALLLHVLLGVTV